MSILVKLTEIYPKLDKKLAYFISIGLLIFLSVLFYKADTSFDLGDGIRHFLISKYSWMHHELFLNSWGKPFFTLVSTVFSQFDLKGIIFFNTLCGVLTGFIAFLMMTQLNVKITWPVIFFVIMAPGYFPTLNSGLTEPFFGLLLMWSIYLYLRNYFLLTAIVISFLPYVRSEGYLIIIVFAALFLYHKKYLQLICLAAGSLIYSIIGFFVFNDFLWLIHQNPYNGKAQSVYGHGTFIHFFQKYAIITGKFLLIFALLGVMFFVYQSIKRSHKSTVDDNKVKVFFYLAGMSFFIYFMAHVIMWWKGWANSLGLIRPIAAVLPCFAVIAYYGFYQMICLVNIKKHLIQALLIIVSLTYMIRKPFTMYYFPFSNTNEEKVLADAVNWIKTKSYDKHLIYYGYPFLGYLLGKDVFDEDKVLDLWSLKSNIKHWSVNAIPEGTIIIWDSHFGPECNISQEDLMEFPEIKYLGSFNTLMYQPNTSYGYFELSIFCKTKEAIGKLVETKTTTFTPLNTDLKNNKLIGMFKEIAPEPVAYFTTKDEYGPVETLYGKDIKQLTNKVNFMTSVLNNDAEDIEVIGVMTAYDAQNNVLDWQGKPFKLKSNTLNNQFEIVEYDFKINPLWSNKGDYKLEFYIWNKHKKSFYQKRMELNY